MPQCETLIPSFPYPFQLEALLFLFPNTSLARLLRLSQFLPSQFLIGTLTVWGLPSGWLCAVSPVASRQNLADAENSVSSCWKIKVRNLMCKASL